MFLCINSSGVEEVIDDDSWKNYYKGKAKEIGLNSCVICVSGGSLFFHFPGNPYGYGGDISQDFLKEQSYGRWRSTHISQIRSTRLEYELYGDDSVHIVRLGNIRFTYRPRYPGNNLSLMLDSVDGMRIEYGSNGHIIKVGGHNI